MPTEFKTALADIFEMPGRPFPRVPETAQVATLVTDDDNPSPIERQPPDARRLTSEILEAIEARRPLTTRQVRSAPWCLWDKDDALGMQPHALRTILDSVGNAERPRPYRTLATAYFDAFRANMSGGTEAARVLGRLALRWPAEPWSALHRQFAVFDPAQGPDRLADAVVAQDNPVSAILAGAGVRAIGARGGYARAITAALLQKLANGAEPDHLERLRRVSRYALENGRLTFDEQSDLFAAAILRPFEGALPDKDVRDRILNDLLAIFDDPRLPPSGGRHVLRSPHRETVIGWLTEQSLRQFLDVVDRISTDGTMWAYRRAFWEGVYEYLRERGVPISAWVAFGPVGEKQAQRSFGDRASFARLNQNGKYVQRTHAVLLMQIGDALVADWNENGKCHIWSSVRQFGTPALFRRTYDSAEVQIYYGTGHHETDTELTWGHGSSKTLSWQHKVARRLSDILNVPIPEHVYRLGHR